MRSPARGQYNGWHAGCPKREALVPLRFRLERRSMARNTGNSLKIRISRECPRSHFPKERKTLGRFSKIMPPRALSNLLWTPSAKIPLARFTPDHRVLFRTISLLTSIFRTISLGMPLSSLWNLRAPPAAQGSGAPRCHFSGSRHHPTKPNRCCHRPISRSLRGVFESGRSAV